MFDSSGYQQPNASTIIPSIITLRAVSPGQYQLVAHLRSGFNTFRQHNSATMPLEEALNWLRVWAEAPADCLWHHFQWRAADIDAAIISAPKTASRAGGRRSPPTAYGNLSLADLGL